MKYIVLYTSLFLLVAFILSHYFLYKYFWTDSKANGVFRSNNVLLTMEDQWIEGHRIHYAIAGKQDHPLLVFIHGSPGSWHRFHRFMLDEDLLAKFQIISIDRPGFGHSDFGNALHLQDQCKLLQHLLTKLKKKQALFLVGHSYGGAVVAQLAANESSLFKTVVIAAGAIDPGLEKKEMWRHIIAQWPFSWLIPGAHKPSNTELLFLKKDLHILAKELGRITCSIKFVHGDRDHAVPVENVAYGQRMMVNAASITIDILKGAGHDLHHKRTEEIKKILLGLE